MYLGDSSAHAVVLCDYGESYFQYDVTGDKGWQIYFKRTLRIKILDKIGVFAGDFQIRLYQDGSDKERLFDIDGITFNMENGKLVKTKLSRSNVMEEEVDKNHLSENFAMPNIKEGSLFDLQYTIVSDFLFNLQPWFFQRSIPVKKSEYYVQIPEYFIYNQTMLGYNALANNQTSTSTKTITFTDMQHADRYNQSSISYTKVDYIVNESRMTMENVPAFIEEAYLSTPNNYLSSLSFELASSKSTTNVFTNYTTTWEKIDELLMRSEDFGPASKHTGFMDEELATINNSSYDNHGKMLAIYDLIRNNIRWNGKKTIFATSTRKAWKDKVGSSAEINLLLTAALRDANLDATPVVLSTRSNGIISPTHPSITDLDYVISLVKIGDQQYLLDATERLAPAGLLPDRCLNDKGRLVNSTGGDWIDLSTKQGDFHMAQYILTLNPDGSVDGKASHVRDAYNALNYRRKVTAAASVKEYYEELEKKIPGYTIVNYEIPSVDSIYLPLKENIEFKLAESADISGELIMLNSLLLEATTDNPFKMKERVYPVEFPYPIRETLIFNWQLPEGWVVDQLPKPVIVALPDNAGKFTYNVNLVGNTITVLSKIVITKTLYIQNEYELIKEFYNQIIAKQKEQIVLKKS
jgi:hypothetical protein